ncbi:uncharacterized protein ACIGJ3_008754 [Trichechus inunguis]
MATKGEGVGSCRFFLPRSEGTDSKVPRRRGHPQFACKEKVADWERSPYWQLHPQPAQSAGPWREAAGTNLVPRPKAQRGSRGPSHQPGSRRRANGRIHAPDLPRPHTRSPTPASRCLLAKGWGAPLGAAAAAPGLGRPLQALSRNRPERELRAGAEKVAANAAGRADDIAEPLPRPPRPLLPPPPPQWTWGRGTGRRPGEEGCLPEFPLLTFNLETRCPGMRRVLRSTAAVAAGVLRVEGRQTPRESSPRPPGSDTLSRTAWAAAGFSTGCDQGGPLHLLLPLPGMVLSSNRMHGQLSSFRPQLKVTSTGSHCLQGLQ